MSTETKTREFTVNYPVEQVKAAVRTVGKTVTNAPFRLIHPNDILGTYGFHVFKGDSIVGLITGDINVTVQSDGDEKTKISVYGIATGNNRFGVTRIVEYQDYLMKMVSQVLDGTFNPEQEVEHNNKGCLSVIVIFILLTAFYACS